VAGTWADGCRHRQGSIPAVATMSARRHTASSCPADGPRGLDVQGGTRSTAQRLHEFLSVDLIDEVHRGTHREGTRREATWIDAATLLRAGLGVSEPSDGEGSFK
jgi:hypothetical protein